MNMQLYVSTPALHMLPEECRVLMNSFFPESTIEMADKADQAIVRVYLDQRLGRIFYKTTEVVFMNDPEDPRKKVKQELYLLLSECTGYNPPWGILMGIRPIKLALREIEDESLDAPHGLQVQKKTELVEFMRDQYLLMPETAKLAVEVAWNEKTVLYESDKEAKTDKRPCAIYIGIPFCPTKCLYCSFSSSQVKEGAKVLDDYLDHLEMEWMALMPHIKSNHDIRSLYIGGGTPSVLDCRQLERLLDMIERIQPLNMFQEVTFEGGRPDTLDRDKLNLLHRYGIERISINPQTMHDESLKRLGRAHSVDQIKHVYKIARDIGFSYINMDIILGLPNETEEDVQETLEEVLALHPEDITIHTLTVKRSSDLRESKAYYSIPQRQVVDRMVDLSKKCMERDQYRPYYLYKQKKMIVSHENIGYTKAQASLYNVQMMEEVHPVFGFGAGASSKIFLDELKFYRVENVKNIEIYKQRIKEMIQRKKEAISR